MLAFDAVPSVSNPMCAKSTSGKLKRIGSNHPPHRRRHRDRLLHFRRHAIVDDDLTRVAQSAGLALDNEIPQSCTGVGYQRLPRGASIRIWLHGYYAGRIERGEFAQRVFEFAAKPAERRGNLLRNLVVERGRRIFGGVDQAIGASAADS